VDSITKSSGKKKKAPVASKKLEDEEEDSLGFGIGLQTGNENVMGKKRKRKNEEGD
jgi:hypothetical protein